MSGKIEFVAHARIVPRGDIVLSGFDGRVMDLSQDRRDYRVTLEPVPAHCRICGAELEQRSAASNGLCDSCAILADAIERASQNARAARWALDELRQVVYDWRGACGEWED